ncbi:MAG: hypothetical protein MZV70_41560 [Desulfobacterales bacterium]|nr:hypothetical protein [Desulfobacterales bacterium]
MNEIVKHYDGVLAGLLTAPRRGCRRGGAVRGHRGSISWPSRTASSQNPTSICPQHHMMLPRMIQSQVVTGLERPPVEREEEDRSEVMR